MDMETLLIVVGVFLLMLGLGYLAVSRVVEDSVFERLDRVCLALLISISVHIPFYIVYFLELNAWWLLLLYLSVWTSGILFIRARIKISFSLSQSAKLYLLVFWKFLKTVFVAVGIVALVKVSIVGILLLTELA